MSIRFAIVAEYGSQRKRFAVRDVTAEVRCEDFNGMLQSDEHDVAVMIDMGSEVICEVIPFGGRFTVADVESVCVWEGVKFVPHCLLAHRQLGSPSSCNTEAVMRSW